MSAWNKTCTAIVGGNVEMEMAAWGFCLFVGLSIVFWTLALRVKRWCELPSIRVGPLEVFRNYYGMSILEFHHENARRAKACGETCWSIGLAHDTRVIGTVDSEVVRHALVSRFENYDKGPRWREIFKELLGNGIFNADGEAWRRQRKIASYEFSKRRLREFATRVVEENAAKLLEELPGTVDAQVLFSRYTFRVIGEVGFGVAVDDSEAVAFDEATRLSASRFVDPFWRLKRIFNVGTERQLAEAVRGVRDFAGRVIREAPKDGADILSLYYRRGERKLLVDVVVNFLLAGRDTTANLLTWALVRLAEHPDIVARLREGNDPDYVKAVLTEVLRLHPSVHSDFKTANQDDLLPGGVPIKRGERIMFCTWSMGRQPDLWGPNCLEFDPSRHLDRRGGGGGGGEFRPPKVEVFPAFHAGPRLCLGKDLAYISAGKLLVDLLTKFDFELLVPPDEVRYDNGMTLWVQGGLPVKFTSRRRRRRADSSS
ncbi:hypothetical protein CTAYLR_004596 [Chrysophaeum taylorii]|uniref:Cytochrome P450 n=1 Tax=Chrysophaeum taylorii TaxID=2483200 RepID=A0AAD7UF16_9STRA|nr:hypothetical protein CTAYLR_004596 [Chrysophaeum taylorii]